MPPSISLAFSFAALLNPAAASFHWFGPPKSDSNSPKSTANWSPAMTADLRGGADHGLRLEARARFPPNVCGWIGGQDSLPVTCSSFSSCAWNSDNNYVGCCATSNHACTFYTACIDGNSPPQTAGDKSDVYTCKGTSACYRNTYPNSYYQWGCGKSNYATAVATTFSINGGSGPDALQIVITGNAPAPSPSSTVVGPKTVVLTVTAPAPPASVAPTTVTADKTTTQVITTSLQPKSSTTTSKTSQGPSPNTSTPTTNTETSTSTSTETSQPTTTGAEVGSGISTASASAAASSDNPKSHKGAIIGGIVGGFGLVSIILAVSFFVLRRRKASKRRDRYVPYNPPESPAVWHN